MEGLSVRGGLPARPALLGAPRSCLWPGAAGPHTGIRVGAARLPLLPQLRPLCCPFLGRLSSRPTGLLPAHSLGGGCNPLRPSRLVGCWTGWRLGWRAAPPAGVPWLRVCPVPREEPPVPYLGRLELPHRMPGDPELQESGSKLLQEPISTATSPGLAQTPEGLAPEGLQALPGVACHSRRCPPRGCLTVVVWPAQPAPWTPGCSVGMGGGRHTGGP